MQYCFGAYYTLKSLIKGSSSFIIQSQKSTCFATCSMTLLFPALSNIQSYFSQHQEDRHIAIYVVGMHFTQSVSIFFHLFPLNLMLILISYHLNQTQHKYLLCFGQGIFFNYAESVIKTQKTRLTQVQNDEAVVTVTADPCSSVFLHTDLVPTDFKTS